MDQDSTDGNDKRNWRERLGIGAKDGVPRVAGDFKQPASERSTAAPARPVASSVKPAPMAPRLGPRPSPAPSTPAPAARQPAAAPDALAAKLRAQREAAEKLAEQRVNAARQRPDSPKTDTGKPKFSFADPDAPRAQPPVQTNTATPPVPKFAAPAQQPARQQLGQGAGFKPMPPAAPPSYAQQQPPQRSFPPQPQQPQAPAYQRQYTQPPYPQQPSYRPVDPNTGYTQPPGYVPPQQRSNYTPPAFPPQPGSRAVPPTRGGQPPYQSAQPDLRSSPRLGSGAPVRSIPQVGFEDDQDDIFEQPAAPVGRRATANDYQQAYRSAEPAYEDDLPRSRLPLILMILLVLALASGIGGIWAYNNLIKGNTTTSADNAAAPVVAAPTQPAKVNPDTNAKADQSAPPAAGSNKKQIYDRIIGDHEVLSGEMKANEEAPVQPDANAAPPSPGDQPSAGTGDNGMPLPLPPPPGSSGGTQGSLDQNNGSKVAQNTTAAEPSSAALSTGGGLPAPVPAPVTANSKMATPAEPPVPSSQPSKLAATDNAANTITDQPDPTVAAPAKPVEPKLAEAKKAATAKSEKNLGAKPVVLVPPADDVASAETTVAPIAPAPSSNTNSLYNGPAVGTGVQATNPAVVAAPAPVPAKRKTLSDLFKSSSATPAPQATVQSSPAVPAAPSAPVASASPVAATGFVAQLTTFKTKAEASAEYARLVQKHGPIISKYAPIIVSAEVAGSPRFRLNIGPMPTMEVATNICSSLFAAGERDCVVHRQ